MAEIVEEFERKARFKDEIEADLIREKLETLVISILTKVEQRDERFESTLIQSGSVYEGAKVRQPDEFDFMVKLNSLTNKPSFHQCEKREGYVKLALEETEWREFRDEEGFFSPNMVCPIHDKPRLHFQSCKYEGKAICPFTTSSMTRLQQASWIVVAWKAQKGIAPCATPGFYSIGAVPELLFKGLCETFIFRCLHRALLTERAVCPFEKI